MRSTTVALAALTVFAAAAMAGPASPAGLQQRTMGQVQPYESVLKRGKTPEDCDDDKPQPTPDCYGDDCHKPSPEPSPDCYGDDCHKPSPEPTPDCYGGDCHDDCDDSDYSPDSYGSGPRRRAQGMRRGHTSNCPGKGDSRNSGQPTLPPNGGFGPWNYGPEGFDPTRASPNGGGGNGWHNVQGGGACPDSYDPDSSQCCYDAYGNLLHPKEGCHGEVMPPKKHKHKKPFVCDAGGSKKGGLPLIGANVANCDSICVLAQNCPQVKDCKVGGPAGSIISVNALECDNINILSSVGGR